MSKDINLAGQPVICQLLSFIPMELVNQAVGQHSSDKGYTEMITFRHLVFILYGVIARCHSLNHLCKSLLFLENKLSYVGITNLPAKSTLSDANKNRDSDVFGTLYTCFTNITDLGFQLITLSYLSMMRSTPIKSRSLIPVQ